MSTEPPRIDEWVVLVDETGEAVGRARKAEVHHAETPFHLAFSCYVFNDDGELLMTRRSLEKVAWPGVWTNSFCGHPAPGESFKDAIVRRAEFELGLEVSGVEVRLPRFQYRAVDASGIVEHEFCPVFTARAASDPRPNPDEIAEWAWVRFADAVRVAQTTPRLISPWMVEQLEQLALLLPNR